MSLLQLCGIALTAAILSMTVKRLKFETGLAVTVGGIILILIPIIEKYGVLINEINSLINSSDNKKYILLAVKSLGIGITVKIVSDICRECGEDSLAGGVELAGKLEILLLCIPYAVELIKISTEIMG